MAVVWGAWDVGAGGRHGGGSGGRYLPPGHPQTFKLSFEPFREPIERFVAALADEPERIALREIGETFVLPAGRY